MFMEAVDNLAKTIPWYLHTDEMHRLRKAKGITSRDLFEQASLDISMLDRWECGSVSIAKADVVQLARVLGVTYHQLVLFLMDDLKPKENE